LLLRISLSSFFFKFIIYSKVGKEVSDKEDYNGQKKEEKIQGMRNSSISCAARVGLRQHFAFRIRRAPGPQKTKKQARLPRQS